MPTSPKQDIADICACFQYTATECLCRKLEKQSHISSRKYPSGRNIVVSGGVASNTYLRAKLQKLADDNGLIFAAPPIRLYDNWCYDCLGGIERFRKGFVSPLDFKPVRAGR